MTSGFQVEDFRLRALDPGFGVVDLGLGFKGCI